MPHGVPMRSTIADVLRLAILRELVSEFAVFGQVIR